MQLQRAAPGANVPPTEPKVHEYRRLLVAEDHVRGASVGPLFQRILADQFSRLRDGDRFWYERSLPGELVELVEQQSLARIIRRNTRIGRELPDDVFRVR